MALLLGTCISLPGYAQPVLRSMQPIALQRGATTKVRFNGDALTGVYQTLCYTSGIQDSDWNVREDAKQATVNMTIPVDFDRGWHSVRLVSTTGISELKTFYVSDQQLTAESQKPHRHDTPQELTSPSLLAGTLQPRDFDVYAFDAQPGQRISVEIHGLRAGRAMFDPRLDLIGPDGSTLGQSDDTALTRQDPFLSVIASSSGRHLIVVTESQNSGNNGFWYLLHLGSFPRPSMAKPLGGKPGSELNLTWLNEVGPMFDQPITLPAERSDEFPVFAEDENGVAPSPIRLRVNDLPVVNELEPNGPKSPQPISFPVAIHGAFQQEGDDDLFRVSVSAGQVLDVRAYARYPSRSAIDTVLAIRKSDNSYVMSNDDANGGPDSMIRHTFAEAGEYFILIRDQMARGRADLTYRLEIQPPAARLFFTSPERQRNVSATVAVPRGNRMALLVYANRIDVGGEVKLVAGQLPDQVTVANISVPADRYKVPVLFEAADSARASAALVTLSGKITRESDSIDGQLEIRHRLVSGRNNVDMLSVTLDELATVVTDPVPVKLQIVEPQVPLVRSGSMKLRIQSIRESDFTGPITVTMLYNDNGVSSQGSAIIPEGQNEITLTLTASAGAQLGNWPIVVLGSGNLPGRRFQISTQVANLQIADSFFGLQFKQSNIEQGSSSTYSIGLSVKQPFEGNGTAELLGLPPGVTAEPVTFTSTDTTLAFSLQAADAARTGRFEGISCRLTIYAPEEPIVHVLGGGSLRVDAKP